MNALLAGVPPDLVLLGGIMIGVWWSNLSRRDQGRRLGQLEKLVAMLHGRKADLTPAADRPKMAPP